MKTETKTRQWDQFLGILPSKEDILDFGVCSLCVITSFSIALGSVALVLWATGNL